MKIGGNEGIAAKCLPALTFMLVCMTGGVIGEQLYRHRQEIYEFVGAYPFGATFVALAILWLICIIAALFGRDD